MAGEWREVVLGDVADLIRGVSYRPTELVERGPEAVPLLRATNIGDHTLDLTDVLYVPSRLVSDSQYLRPFDIVIAMSSGSRQAIGRLAQIRHEWTGCVGAFCGVIRPNHERVYPEYLGYVLYSPEFRTRIETYAVGTAIMNLSRERILGFPFKLPPLPEQRAIAHILGTLDDKIELNRRMSETLEQVARAIFKAWFVDFEPVRAKMEGRWRRGESLPGLPAHLYDLFPDRLVDSELGPIPEGWEVLTIGEVVEVGGGSTPSTKEASFWDGEICWATPKDLSLLHSPVLLDTERKITEAGLREIGSRLFPKGTVLLSSRAPIGYVAISEVPIAVNQGIIAIICNQNVSNHYMMHWINANMELIESRASGTTFQEISKSDFRSIRVIIPATGAMQAFTKTVASLYSHVVNNMRESRTLAALRDALLPKLVRGEIRVRDAERFLRERGL